MRGPGVAVPKRTRARGSGAGQKVAYRRRAGRAAARSSLSMLSVRPLWAPIGPYEPGRRDKEGLAWPGRGHPRRPPPIARLGKAGCRPATPPGRGEPAPLGPGWGRSAAAAPSPLPCPLQEPSVHPRRHGAPASLPSGGSRRLGAALTSGLASAAAVRAHPPSGSAEGGRRGAIALRGRPRARASALGAPPGRRARGARRAAAAAGAERRALRPGARRPQSPGRALGGLLPAPQGPPPLRRCPPPPPRGGAAPTNWGARLAALRSPPRAAAPGTVRRARAPALAE